MVFRPRIVAGTSGLIPDCDYCESFVLGHSITLHGPHRDDGKRFVVRADEKLTACVELERAIHQFAVSLLS